jgi:hypothetical protein
MFTTNISLRHFDWTPNIAVGWLGSNLGFRDSPQSLGEINWIHMAMNTSFHIIYNSLFTDHVIVRRYMYNTLLIAPLNKP